MIEEPETVNASRMVSNDAYGFCDLYNAPAPDTKGADNARHPLIVAYPPFAEVEFIYTPGAAISIIEP